MNFKKGSLVLSLVATVTVAATIIVTHQVAQRFASGAVGAYTQEQAYILAQKSLAVAGLMVNRNVVLCSDLPMTGGQVKGCDEIGPLAKDKRAHHFYDRLDLDDRSFAVMDSPQGAYAKKFLKFRSPSSGHHPVFKNAEITWRLMSLNNSNLRSISGAFHRGYVCRSRQTSGIIKGYCPALEERSDEDRLLENRESVFLTEKKCKTDSSGTSEIPNSVCDYYAHSDGDGVVVFISVKVPYKSTDTEEEETKHLLVNAAIRRPMPVFKIFVKEDTSVCAISCMAAARADMNATALNPGALYPQCAGLVSGNQDGGGYFQNDIHATNTRIKIKNYGPGVLYGMSLMKEDIDPNRGQVLGRSMIGFSAPPLEAGGLNTDISHSAQDGEKEIAHITPCYYASLYTPDIQVATYHCDVSDSADKVNTAGGVVCKAGKSTSHQAFVDGIPGVVQDYAFARTISDIRCPTQSSNNIPALSNAVLTAFEKPCGDNLTNCKFSRIPGDQNPGENKSWCGGPYQAGSKRTPTGRFPYGEAPLSSFPAVVIPSVYQASNQQMTPVGH